MGLLEVNDQFVQAVEAGAGGKLMNIVVSNDQISKNLLTQKCFDNFVIFMPLNKIQALVLNQKQLDNAMQAAKTVGGHIWLPTSKEVCRPLDNRFQPVLDLCMMGFVITDSLDAANLIASHPQTPIKAVTLDGNMIDPNGISIGGFMDKRNSLFQKFQILKELRRKYDSEGQLSSKGEIQHRLVQFQKQETDLEQSRVDLQQKTDKIDRVKDKVRQLQEEIQVDNVDQISKRITNFKNRVAEVLEECKSIENQIFQSQHLVSSINKGVNVDSILRDKLTMIQEEEINCKQLKQKYLVQVSEAEATVQKETTQIENLKNRLEQDREHIAKIKVVVEERLRYGQSEERALKAVEVVASSILDSDAGDSREDKISRR